MKHRSLAVTAAVISLALGGFGIGATEFVAMGLLPEMTQDLLAAAYQADRDAALGTASWFVTAYAVGVVCGAPLMIALSTRLSYKASLLLFVGIFALGTVFTAVAPSFEVAVVSRFLAALPHGAYFGVAPLVAGQLLGLAKRGAGVAYVLLGLTVCNLLGVPLFTALGQQAGWRTAYLVIAGVFAVALLAIIVTVPRLQPATAMTLRTQLAAFKSGMLWAAVAVVALGMAGYFALYSYISPVVTELAVLPLGAVPWALATAGCGMTCGTLLGGKLADRNPQAALRLALLTFTAALTVTALIAHLAPLLLLGIFVCSAASSMLVPPAQLWLMDIAAKAPVLGGALVHAAFNAANALGAAGAGAVIAAGLGFRAPLLFAAVMGFLGLGSYLLVRARTAPTG